MKVSLFQEVGIEGFHCVYRSVLISKGAIYSSTVYRGVFISGGWNKGIPQYTEVSSFQFHVANLYIVYI